jgi:transcriptional regulator GlxA family with amidase domain
LLSQLLLHMHASVIAHESSEAHAPQPPVRPDGNRSSSPSLEGLGTLAAECNYSTRGLAKRLGISVRQLQRTFQARLQCSPRDWLREVRLQKARDMLPAAASVKQVAYALGFRQQSQFCRDFKRRFGFSPSRALPVGNSLRSLLEEAKRPTWSPGVER